MPPCQVAPRLALASLWVDALLRPLFGDAATGRAAEALQWRLRLHPAQRMRMRMKRTVPREQQEVLSAIDGEGDGEQDGSREETLQREAAKRLGRAGVEDVALLALVLALLLVLLLMRRRARQLSVAV